MEEKIYGGGIERISRSCLIIRVQTSDETRLIKGGNPRTVNFTKLLVIYLYIHVNADYKKKSTHLISMFKGRYSFWINAR